jgi:hypothetical protein
MADFGFVGGAYEAPSIYQDAQELINWYCEIDSEKKEAAYVQALNIDVDRGVVALYPTPGYTVVLTLCTNGENPNTTATPPVVVPPAA